jgi:cytochrome b561
LHGFGFASALNETGLPTEAIPLALLMFNLGVELGQLLFVALVWGLLVLLARLPAQPPAWSRKVAPYAIGSLAMFWVIQRLSGLI